MNRKQFQSQLSRGLRFRFSKKEAREIMADYDECFDAGVAEGKAEEALCQEFGVPKDIIRELARERPFQWKVSPIQFLGWVMVIFPIIIVAACITGDMPPFRNAYLMDLQPIFLFLAPAVLFFLLGGVNGEDSKPKTWHIHRSPGWMSILCGFCYFHITGTLVSVCWIFEEVRNGIPEAIPGWFPWLYGLVFMQLSNYGPYVAVLFYSCLISMLVVILLQFALYRRSLWICPMMFFNAGMLVSIERMLWMLSQISSLEDIPVMLQNTMLTFLWGVVLSIGSAVLLYIFPKRQPPSTNAPFVKKVV